MGVTADGEKARYVPHMDFEKNLNKKRSKGIKCYYHKLRYLPHKLNTIWQLVIIVLDG
jgi:hypothetical protein